MKNEQDLIEGHLRGKLNQKEQISFNNRKKNDPSFAAEVAKQKNMQQFIRVYNRAKTREKLQGWDLEPEIDSANEVIKGRFGQYRLLAVAASILLLVTLGINAYENTSPSPTELYTDYFVPYPDQITRLAPSEEALELQAMQYYQKGQYEQAIPVLEQLETLNSDPIYKLYLGICALETNQQVKAKQIFEQSLEIRENAEAAQWYLGLFYLKNNELEKAKIQFQQITKTGGYKHQEATELLNKLN